MATGIVCRGYTGTVRMSEFLQQVAIGDDYLQLSLWQRTDAEALYQLIRDNRAHLRPWLGWIGELSDPAACEEYIRQLQQAFIARRSFPCAVTYGGELMGFCGLDRINRFQNKGRIGYWLTHSHQGKGLMMAACRMLLTHSFEVLELDLVECLVAEDNQRSRALCERLGLLLQAERLEENLRCYYMKREDYRD